jgi:hypothetical protein
MENITSQNKAIRAHLESGKSITPLEALYSFGCWALSSRMSDLKKQGLKFKSELIEKLPPVRLRRYLNTQL